MVATKVYRKNAHPWLERDDQDEVDDDDAYRVSANGSVYFRASGQVSEVVIPDVHQRGDSPGQTYEVLVFGVDPIEGQQQQQQRAVNAAPIPGQAPGAR